MVRKLVASLFAALLLTTMSAALVGAAPVNNPHAEFFTLECDNGETYDIVVGSGNPAHVIDSTQRIVPHHFSFELIVVNADGVETVLFDESGGVGEGQKKGLQDRLVTCTTESPVPEDELEFILNELDIDLTGQDAYYRITVQAIITPGGPKK